MKQKYGFIGSHGVGKSSAATYLASVLKKEYRHKSVKVLEENVREIARFFDGKINTPAFQKLCMVDHLQKEFVSEQLHDIVVCDRTALDTLVYGIIYKIPLPPEYFSLAINHLNSFTKLYFVRPDSDVITDDGFRDTNIQIRNDVDKEFERLLSLWGGKYEILYTKDVFTHKYL